MSGSKVPVVYNPVAGGGRLLAQRPAVDAAAAAAGVELEWWPTAAPGDGERLGRRAVAGGYPLTLAFGGDGTYNEVARALLGSDTAMGVVPGGTTSVLAYELGIPRPAPAALEALLGGSDRPMRVGRTDRGEVFLLMLSAGPDAVVLDALLPTLKRRGGKVGIALQAAVELVRARLPRLRVTNGDATVEGGWAIVGNSRCYGGPWAATPAADPFADAFDVVVQRRVGRWAAIAFFLGIPRGAHVRRRDVVRLASQRLVLEPRGGARVPYQVDGDPVGYLPVEVWIDPEPLLVRLPDGTAVAR